MKKLSILIVGFFISSIAFSQNSLVGKWKPVSFTMDKILTADVKAGTFVLSDTVDVLFKDDKDPAASKQFMEFLGQMLLEQMATAQEEYTATGKYIETDTKENKSKTGTYTLSDNVLTRTVNNKQDPFQVSFKNGHLILIGEIGSTEGKKGVLELEYEKVK